MTIAVIDNYDSFTYNLVQYLGELGATYPIAADIQVFRNDCITLDEPHNARAKKKWICRCGAPNCRGHMLGKKS